MFTGLVQQIGILQQICEQMQGRQFVVAANLAQADRAIGASVCVSGVCLTITAADEQTFTCHVAFETLERTTLGSLHIGQKLNLEPSLRLGDALGGHLVAGHVDGVGQIRSLQNRGDALAVWIDAPRHLLPLIAIKGSICVDGVSLTINAVDGAGFSVGLIPHTLQQTTLGERQSGDAVNLEVDLIARYVARLMEVQKDPHESR